MRILIKSKNLSKSTVPKIIDLGILYVFDKKIHFKNSPALKGNVLLPKYPIIWEPNKSYIEGFISLKKDCHLSALI